MIPLSTSFMKGKKFTGFRVDNRQILSDSAFDFLPYNFIVKAHFQPFYKVTPLNGRFIAP